MGKKDKYADKKPVAPQTIDPVAPSTSAAASQQSAPFISSAPTISRHELIPLRAQTVEEAKKRFQGTKGMKCKLEANLMHLNVSKIVADIYHYDVSVTPIRPKKFLPQVLKDFFGKNFNGIFYAFDSFANESADADVVRTNVYINQKLKIPEAELTGEVTIDGRKFKVTIKLATTVDMKEGLKGNVADQQAVQCVDIVLRAVFRDALSRGDAILSGKRIFFPQHATDFDNRNPLYQKIKILPGIFQSALICRSGMFLNLDITHKAFRMDVPVLEYIRICLRMPEPPVKLSAIHERCLQSELSGLLIECKIIGTERVRTHKFVKFAPANTTFELEMEGKPKQWIAVVEYYRKFKNYRVKYPLFPLIHVGTREKPLYFPVELCSMTRQSVQCDIVSETAVSCPERKRKIISVGSNLKFGDSKVIKSFGINLDNNCVQNFATTEGRILDPPKLQYQNGLVSVDINRGSWNGNKFLKTDGMTNNLKWSVLSTNGVTLENMVSFAKAIADQANQQGINLYRFQNKTDYIMQCNLVDIADKLKDLKSKQYGLVFVIIDDRNPDSYSNVKCAAELESSKIAIMTQCLKGSTFKRMIGNTNSMRNIVGNLLLKDNGKLNGTNYAIEEKTFEKHHGTMYVGADVNHPGSSSLKPSVVGISASEDLIGMRYSCIYKYQKPRQEMISGFEGHIKVFLNRYKVKNGKYPERIIYLRDGVSEGQFSEVLEGEWIDIKRGVAAIYGSKAPKMAFICVQKRHHLRLFPLGGKTNGKNENIVPGTCVDSDIVHPTYFQFYLASHAAIQGTTRPAKYCVLKDEIGMSVDDLQAITHDLCHAFIRCTRPVSYPAPTYYSHLIAKRAEAYLGSYIMNEESSLDEINKTFKISQNFINNTQMFFV